MKFYPLPALKIALLSFLTLTTLSGSGQILEPVSWSYSSRTASGGEAVLVLKATLDPGWHLYSQFVDEGGPIPTNFTFQESDDYRLIGEVEEKSPAEKVMDPNFGMEVLYFSGEAVFEQKIALNKPEVTVSGTVEFMVCDDSRCLPPEEVAFTIPVKEGEPSGETGGEKVTADPAPGRAAGTPSDTGAAAPPQAGPADGDTVRAREGGTGATVQEEKRTILGIFIAGFAGGLLALFMPCIFPLIPLTVSYFTKQSGGKGKAIGSAILYGISIIAIYVALGLLITVLFGSSKLNELASNGFLNILFFTILIIFAISFFGAFELTLPSSWTTMADRKAESRGLAGIFFMAVALTLASFSCTGPIIGSLLVEAASKGALLGPATGMFGFALALAIPFTLFAIFPGWLQSLPKSGGWLNAVKVSLGFLELAFALKFLSNVDMAYHWNILSRDIFIVLWIIIFTLWGFYLIGKLRFKLDSDLNYISVPRLFFAILAFGFAAYLVPGLWGAPLKPISSFLPAYGQDFDLYTASFSGGQAVNSGQENGPKGKKYSDLFHAPLGLNVFFDYDQALEYAKKVDKPVFIDFTGWSCTNCRRIEASVWPDKRVLSRLRNDYVLVQLYVDDRTKLPEEEQYVSEFSGKKINTIGKKWSDFQASRFITNSQPYYVLVDHEGNKLVEPIAFELNINKYVDFLDRGLKAFEQRKTSTAAK